VAQFNIDLLKKFIAPAIDEKPEVRLADLSAEFKEAERWFSQYFLNSVFTGEFSGEMRPYAESIVARIQFVFGGYGVARAKTYDYADKWKLGAPGIIRYLAAVGEWEGVFINIQVIYDLLGKCFGSTISGREERTRWIANRIKHSAEDIECGKLNGPGLPLWLTKEGFATIRASMTFEEMEGQVRFLAKVADCLSVPADSKNRFAALDSALAGDPNYSPTD
jgi:hypothetical protein